MVGYNTGKMILPCQILLRGIRHKRHEHRHHLFSPLSERPTIATVVGPFCMYGSCIARSAKGLIRVE